MTTISRGTATCLPQRQGVSYLIAMMIAVVATGGIAYAIFGDLEGTFGTMTGADRIEIIDLNAYTRGDSLVITGNIKNIGNSGMDSVVIDEISVGDLVLTQTAQIDDGAIADGHGTLTIEYLDNNENSYAATDDRDDVESNATAGTGTAISLGVNQNTPAGTVDPLGYQFQTATGTPAAVATGVARVTLTGLSTNEDTLSPLASGASQSFRITITGVSANGAAGVLDILESVPASSDLFASFTGTDGTTTTISDPRSTTVTRR